MRGHKLGFTSPFLVCKQSELHALTIPLIKIDAKCKIELSYRLINAEAGIDKKFTSIVQNDRMIMGDLLQMEFNSFRPSDTGYHNTSYSMPNTTFRVILLSARKHGLARFSFDPIRIDREKQSVDVQVNNNYANVQFLKGEYSFSDPDGKEFVTLIRKLASGDLCDDECLVTLSNNQQVRIASKSMRKNFTVQRGVNLLNIDEQVLSISSVTAQAGNLKFLENGADCVHVIGDIRKTAILITDNTVEIESEDDKFSTPAVSESSLIRSNLSVNIVNTVETIKPSYACSFVSPEAVYLVDSENVSKEDDVYLQLVRSSQNSTNMLKVEIKSEETTEQFTATFAPNEQFTFLLVDTLPDLFTIIDPHPNCQFSSCKVVSRYTIEYNKQGSQLLSEMINSGLNPNLSIEIPPPLQISSENVQNMLKNFTEPNTDQQFQKELHNKPSIAPKPLKTPVSRHQSGESGSYAAAARLSPVSRISENRSLNFKKQRHASASSDDLFEAIRPPQTEVTNFKESNLGRGSGKLEKDELAINCRDIEKSVEAEDSTERVSSPSYADIVKTDSPKSRKGSLDLRLKLPNSTQPQKTQTLEYGVGILSLKSPVPPKITPDIFQNSTSDAESELDTPMAPITVKVSAVPQISKTPDIIQVTPSNSSVSGTTAFSDTRSESTASGVMTNSAILRNIENIEALEDIEHSTLSQKESDSAFKSMLENDPQMQAMLISLQEMGMLDSSSDESEACESEVAKSENSEIRSKVTSPKPKTNLEFLEAFSRKNQVVPCEETGGIDMGMESSENSRASSIAEPPFSASAAKEFMAEIERLHAEINTSPEESEEEVDELSSTSSSDTLSDVDDDLEMKIVEEAVESKPVMASQHQVRKAISSYDFDTSPKPVAKGGSVMTARIKAAFSENKLNMEKPPPIFRKNQPSPKFGHPSPKFGVPRFGRLAKVDSSPALSLSMSSIPKPVLPKKPAMTPLTTVKEPREVKTPIQTQEPFEAVKTLPQVSRPLPKINKNVPTHQKEQQIVNKVLNLIPVPVLTKPMPVQVPYQTTNQASVLLPIQPISPVQAQVQASVSTLRQTPPTQQKVPVQQPNQAPVSGKIPQPSPPILSAPKQPINITQKPPIPPTNHTTVTTLVSTGQPSLISESPKLARVNSNPELKIAKNNLSPLTSRRTVTPSLTSSQKDCPFNLSWSPKPVLRFSTETVTFHFQKKPQFLSDHFEVTVLIKYLSNPNTENCKQLSFQRCKIFFKSHHTENVCCDLNYKELETKFGGNRNLVDQILTIEIEEIKSAEIADDFDSIYEQVIYDLPTPNLYSLVVEDDSPKFQYKVSDTRLIDRGRFECGFDSDHNLLVLGVDNPHGLNFVSDVGKVLERRHVRIETKQFGDELFKVSLTPGGANLNIRVMDTRAIFFDTESDAKMVLDKKTQLKIFKCHQSDFQVKIPIRKTGFGSAVCRIIPEGKLSSLLEIIEDTISFKKNLEDQTCHFGVKIKQKPISSETSTGSKKINAKFNLVVESDTTTPDPSSRVRPKFNMKDRVLSFQVHLDLKHNFISLQNQFIEVFRSKGVVKFLIKQLNSVENDTFVEYKISKVGDDNNKDALSRSSEDTVIAKNTVIITQGQNFAECELALDTKPKFGKSEDFMIVLMESKGSSFPSIDRKHYTCKVTVINDILPSVQFQKRVKQSEAHVQ